MVDVDNNNNYNSKMNIIYYYAKFLRGWGSGMAGPSFMGEVKTAKTSTTCATCKHPELRTVDG
eukprot:m.18433 g.18433  ORF g.18433 m.18433 type:complete len:63 (+) comp4960_c0_seq1:2320-2508(+)